MAGVTVPTIAGFTAIGVVSSVLVSMSPMLRGARAGAGGGGGGGAGRRDLCPAA
ncbi:hypothetical protein ACFQZZ_30420 [Nocardia sp. GCM10030253]|uniref:hypothetical protein n=1 Tax=Nocardia sp. GCM10030253 TaxID=3273404 RepID=UPI00363F94B5